jgi:5-methylcytosine-specific restriction endonuclease McrA
MTNMNIEKKREYDSKRYKANPKKRELNQLWRKSNPKYIRKWHEANPEYDRKRYEANREHIIEYSRKWRKTHLKSLRVHYHNRQAKIKGNGGVHTTEEINNLFKEQGGCCFYCNQQLEEFHIDHKTPISRGGSNNIDNIALACAPCNLSKHTKTAEEFIALINGQ